MKTVAHLAARDLLRMRGAWIAWLALVAAHLALVDAGPALVFMGALPGQAFVSAGTGLMFAEFVFFWLAVSLTVHADPIGDSRAFWRTRPITPATLWAAKLVTLGLMLVIIPVLLSGARLAWHGAPAGAVAAAVVQGLLTRGAWLTQAWAVTAATRSTKSFVLAAAGAVAVLFAVTMVLSMAWVRSAADRLPGLPDPPLPDDTHAYALGLWLTCAGLAMVLVQYRTRRTAVAAVLAVALVVPLPFVGLVQLPDVARAVEPAPPAWLEQTPITLTHLGLDGDLTRPGREPVVELEGRMSLGAVHFGTYVEALSRRLEVVLRDGTTIRTSGTIWGSRSNSERRRLAVNTVRQASTDPLAPVPAGGPGEASFGSYLSESDAGQLRGQRGTLRMETELRLFETRVVGTLSLEPGAQLEAGGYRTEIVGVRPTSAGPEVLVRQVRYPAFRPGIVAELTFAVPDGVQSERVGAGLQREFVWDALPGFAHHLPRERGPLSSPWGMQWQTVWQVIVPSSRETAPDRPATSLLVIETRYAGRTTRTLRADDVAVTSGDQSAAQR